MPKTNFMEKTFAGGSQTVKFGKVFSLESSPPPYGIYFACCYVPSWLSSVQQRGVQWPRYTWSNRVYGSDRRGNPLQWGDWCCRLCTPPSLPKERQIHSRSWTQPADSGRWCKSEAQCQETLGEDGIFRNYWGCAMKTTSNLAVVCFTLTSETPYSRKLWSS